MRFILPTLALILFSSAAQADISTALRGCLNMAAQGDELKIQKVRPNQSKDTIVMLKCSGEWAKRLYTEVGPYSLESGPTRDEDGLLSINRHFGRISRKQVVSVCARYIETADKVVIDQYICFIRVDLNDLVIKAM